VVVRINLQFTQMQGRYLFPGLPAFAVLMALGLRSITPAVTRLASPPIVGSVLLAANLYTLVGVMWPTYYPAPMRTLDSGVRLVMPTRLIDVAHLELGHGYLVTGPRPGWMSPIDVEAEAFDAFEVELSATATPAPQRACVQFATPAKELDATTPICADWLADGQRHVVRFPLRGQPGWTGHVNHLRLQAVADGTSTKGTLIWTRDPRLLPAAAR
jgi:hypothetical protein